MTEPMKALYAFAQEHIVCRLLEQEREHRDVRLRVGNLEEKIRALLGEENSGLFQALLEEQALLSSFYEWAEFRAGFQTAVELLR